jgi:hypothetical protein
MWQEEDTAYFKVLFTIFMGREKFPNILRITKLRLRI